jgi:chromosome segregation ATPase
MLSILPPGVKKKKKRRRRVPTNVKSKDKEIGEKLEHVRKELEEVRTQILALGAELDSIAGRNQDVSWDDIDEGDAVDELVQRERRRVVVPHQLRAGRIREAELEIKVHELALEECQAEVEPAYQTMLEAEEALEKARTRAANARGSWEVAKYEVSDCRRALMAAKKKLTAAQNVPSDEARGPIVRAAFLANQG